MRGKWKREREKCLCEKGSCSSLASQNPPVWRKYHQGNLVSLPLCVFSSVPGLFLNSVWLPSQTEDDKPQHPYFVVFRIYQFANRSEITTMFSSAPLPQLHCKLFAKMGDDRPFVCSAPGCGQVRLFHTSLRHAESLWSLVNFCKFLCQYPLIGCQFKQSSYCSIPCELSVCPVRRCCLLQQWFTGSSSE